MKSPRRFSVPIKRKAANEFLEGASIKDVARKYAASESSIRRWVQLQETGELDFLGLHPPSHGDRRMLDFCIHCGGSPDTEDHNPSYVFLDKPYPEELAVVGVCGGCNNEFSVDEPYLAALIEAARTGSATPNSRWRRKSRSTVKHNKKLQRLLLEARVEGEADVSWRFDKERVDRVVVKLARGHAAFELHDYPFDPPMSVSVFPVHVLTARERLLFEEPPQYPGYPEVGSRAFYRRLQRFPSTDDNGWVVIQNGRYRYCADGSGNLATVKMVFSEYLGAEVIWDEMVATD